MDGCGRIGVMGNDWVMKLNSFAQTNRHSKQDLKRANRIDSARFLGSFDTFGGSGSLRKSCPTCERGRNDFKVVEASL